MRRCCLRVLQVRVAVAGGRGHDRALRRGPARVVAVPAQEPQGRHARREHGGWQGQQLELQLPRYS